MKHAQTQEIPFSQLSVSPLNARREPGDVSGLAASIRSVGLLQPILVRPASEKGRYEVVAGSRRLSACEQLGWEAITAVVRALSDRDAMLISLTENIQQETLDPVERGEAVDRLVTEFSREMPRTDALDLVARQIGKRTTTIHEWLAVLRTTEGVRQMVRDRIVTSGVAARISALPAEHQEPVARAVAEENLKRADALRVVRAIRTQPTRAVEEVVDEIRSGALDEISVNVSFSGKLYSALADRARADSCSIQEVIRQASRVYVGYTGD